MSSVGPVRPLSHEEWVENSVILSDAVLIGFVESFDSFRVPVGGSLERQDQYMIVRPEKWLKGSPTEPLIRVNVDHARELNRHEYDPKERFFFFLRKWNNKETGKREWVLSSASWPHVPGMGSMTTMEDLPGEVERATRVQTARSMAERADLIILGQPTKQGQDCHPYGNRWRCMRVRVESDIAGTAPDDTVCVFAWLGGPPLREALIFARRMSDGSYEMLSGAAGGMEVVDGRVERTGMPLAKQVGEIRETLARKSRTR